MIKQQIIEQSDQLFRRMQQKYSDLSPVLEKISAVIAREIDLNFDKQGRWDGRGTGLFSGGDHQWTPLARSTILGYRKKGYKLEPTLRRQKNLQRQIEVNPKGTNQIQMRVGDIDYGPIHQFGGTIHHPGGTPYILTPYARFITKQKAKELEDKDKTVFYTKPHDIEIPARPYIVLTETGLDDINDIVIHHVQGS